MTAQAAEVCSCIINSLPSPLLKNKSSKQVLAVLTAQETLWLRAAQMIYC